MFMTRYCLVTCGGNCVIYSDAFTAHMCSVSVDDEDEFSRVKDDVMLYHMTDSGVRVRVYTCNSASAAATQVCSIRALMPTGQRVHVVRCDSSRYVAWRGVAADRRIVSVSVSFISHAMDGQIGFVR